MPELIAKPALGYAPLTLAGTTLAEAPPPHITSIAPFPGRAQAVGAALGLEFPAPNQVTADDRPPEGARLVWAGREMAYLLGRPAPEGLPAAVTDQSDAWVSLSLQGPLAVDTLARLVPLDLRGAAAGYCFRSGLNQMPLLLIVEAPEAFTLMVFRSMARTAWRELSEAMEKVAARELLRA